MAGSASGILNGKRDETVEEKARLSKLKELKDMEMALLERMDGLQDKKCREYLELKRSHVEITEKIGKLEMHNG